MSFFGDLVNSIGTDQRPVLPKPVQRPSIVSSAAHSNPIPRPKSATGVVVPSSAGLKRKLGERDATTNRFVEKIEKVDRPVKPNPASGFASKAAQKPVNPVSNGSKLLTPKPVPKPLPSTASLNSSAPAKPPTKLSYAEKLARAKEAHQTRPQNPIGTIKHQASIKEKPSKLAERRRLEQEKIKAEKDKKVDRTKPGSKVERKRSASPVKKTDRVKAPRAPRPPLHAPASSYKGTMGKAANTPREQRGTKKSRYDEYLGTDEEEDSEMEEEDDGYGYGSEASSDMEAGMDELDLEEAQALRLAKADDAKELALENELKREKEERKRRLTAMAKRGK